MNAGGPARRSTAELEAPVPADAADDFLAKLHYVSESLASFGFVDERRDRVWFELRDQSASDDVSGRIRSVAAKMSAARRHSDARVLVDHLDRPVPFTRDPHDELLATGEIVPFGPGRYAFGPKLTRLMQAFQRCVDRIARDFRATPLTFPTLIGGDVLERCSYIRSFPHSLSLVSHLREDLDAIQDFAKTTRWSADHLAYDARHLAPAPNLLSPSVCFHYYAMHAGSRHPSLLTSTATGKCFRWESGNLTGLERLYDFTMQEVIFLGGGEEVLAKRTQSIDAAVALFDEIGLAYEIRTATDPFFIDSYAPQVTFQKAFELKFEIRALLPYKERTFAIGSFNYHQDLFGRAFDIRDRADQPLHSGCMGFGIERVALAVCAQFGLEPSGWPKALEVESHGAP